MSTCNDCLHAEICPWDCDSVVCERFKDKSKFIELPCKVGDTVFVVCRSRFSEKVAVREEIVKGLQYIHNHWYINTDKHYNYEYGEKVFSNYEEAEKALAERRC